VQVGQSRQADRVPFIAGLRRDAGGNALDAARGARGNAHP
jgi:hypothetical protein